MSHSDVFVIGAGPAGLTAAYLLTKSGISTTVIEADPTYVGGISRTASYKDFLFDIGGHRFFSKSKEVVDLWKEILPDDFIERPRLSRIYYNGNYFSYPLKAFEALNNLGYVESALCVLSYLHKQAFPTANPESFHDWVANQFGERLFSIFFKTYTEKVWGMSCDEISADWAAQRIKGLDLWSAMSNALRNSLPRAAAPKKGGQQIKTLIESFQYPRKGPGMMWDAAARQVKARGGHIHMGTRLESLRWNERAKRWTIGADHGRRANGSRSRRSHVISSAPIRELVGSIHPAAGLQGRGRQAALPRLPHRGADRRQARPVPRQLDLHPRAQRQGRPHPELPLLVAGDGAGRQARLPRPGIFLLRGRRPVERLRRGADRARQEGARHHRPRGRGRGQGRLRRAPEEGLSGLRRELQGQRRGDPHASWPRRFPTLHLVGRNGMHKYNNQDHAMMTAMLTVKNIMAGETVYDVWNVNEDAEYHEAGEAGAQRGARQRAPGAAPRRRAAS